MGVSVAITDAMVERAVKAWRDEWQQEYPGSGNWPAMRAALDAALNPPRHKHTARCYDAFAKPGFQGPDCGFEDEDA